MQSYIISEKNTMKKHQPQSLFMLLSLIMIVSSNNELQPPMIHTTQTHIIPNDGYFQYTFTRMKLEEPKYNTTISESKDQIIFSLDFQPELVGSSIIYNLLVFPQNNPDSEHMYQNYVKAVVQGLPGLMPVFPNNYTDLTGSCQQCYQTAIESMTPMACLQCNSTRIQIITKSQNWTSPSQPWNSTIMTIIDNTQVLGPTGDEITLNLGYEIDILYEGQYEALFILFFSVICALIIILSVLAVFITLRIKKVEKQISEHKGKIKTE